MNVISSDRRQRDGGNQRVSHSAEKGEDHDHYQDERDNEGRLNVSDRMNDAQRTIVDGRDSYRPGKFVGHLRQESAGYYLKLRLRSRRPDD